MSMFQDLLGKLAAGQSGESEAGGLLSQLLGAKGEGVHELLGKMKEQGLGDVVNSWISKGKNLAIDPEKFNEILGSDQMKALAQRLGLPQDKIADLLAKHLPGIVDKMSPEGELPAEAEEDESSDESEAEEDGEDEEEEEPEEEESETEVEMEADDSEESDDESVDEEGEEE